MTVQLSVAARNARLDSIETTLGTTPILEIRTGAQPANCAAADSGTVLATLNLPSDWASNAASGVKSMLGSWADAAADATGTAAHFRLKNSAGSTTHMQGSVGLSATDMIVDSVSFTAGQGFSITSWALTDGNA